MIYLTSFKHVFHSSDVSLNQPYWSDPLGKKPNLKHYKAERNLFMLYTQRDTNKMSETRLNTRRKNPRYSDVSNQENFKAMQENTSVNKNVLETLNTTYTYEKSTRFTTTQYENQQLTRTSNAQNGRGRGGGDTPSLQNPKRTPISQQFTERDMRTHRCTGSLYRLPEAHVGDWACKKAGPACYKLPPLTGRLAAPEPHDPRSTHLCGPAFSLRVKPPLVSLKSILLFLNWQWENEVK